MLKNTHVRSKKKMLAIGIVTGFLGLVMGAIYFFKWRHEPLAVRANQTSRGGALVVADELSKLASLRDQGVITTEDFEAQKKKLFDCHVHLLCASRMSNCPYQL